MKQIFTYYLLLVTCFFSYVHAYAQKKLLILGSSTSACYNISPDSCYVGRLQRYYQLAGSPVVIDNRAVAGDNCYHGMPSDYTPPTGRNAPRPYNNITEGLQGNPDIVLVNYPSNNYDVYTVPEIMFCLRTIKQMANNAGKPCYVTTTQPRSEPASFQTPEVRQKMQVIRDSILGEFGQYAINFWDGIVNPADNSLLPMYNSGDGTHLTSAGHTILFNQVVSKNIFSPQQPGLTYRYYEGDWNTLPDFNALTPVKTGSTANIDLNARNVNDYFGFVWEGYINIPTPGTYNFETVSDDGSKFYFNTSYSSGATALVNNDGTHGTVSAYGSVYIPAAGRYPVAITFFEKNVEEVMQLYWSGPGFQRQMVPDNAFTGTTTVSSGGLNYKYYEGEFSALPDFNALTPVKSGTSANLDLGVRTAGVDDRFALLWSGYINLPTAGTYTFETISDDGSKFYFDMPYSAGATSLVNNDGQHGPYSVSGTVTAAAGKHPVAITFFEKDGGETMQLYWTGPGFNRQPVPDEAFSVTAAAGSITLKSAIQKTAMASETKLAGDAAISVYPNPFAQSFTINYYNARNTGNKVSIGIYDLHAKLIYTCQPDNLVAGNNTWNMQIAGRKFTPGVYMVRLIVNGITVKTLKLVKMNP